MRTSFLKTLPKLLLVAMTAAFTGCIVADHSIQAGDPLNATFSLTWQVNDNVTGQPVDCVAIGADAVLVTSTNRSTGDVFIDIYDCLDGQGVTDPVVAGDYDVTADLAYCGTDAACSQPDILSYSDRLGPYSVYDDFDTDVGHVVFLVN